jgi:hypothetical protein
MGMMGVRVSDIRVGEGQNMVSGEKGREVGRKKDEKGRAVGKNGLK